MTHYWLQIRLKNKEERIKAYKVAKQKGYDNISQCIRDHLGLPLSKPGRPKQDIYERRVKAIGDEEEVIESILIEKGDDND